ncbi:MAG: MFS transporter [Actinomycetota bacterium]
MGGARGELLGEGPAGEILAPAHGVRPNLARFLLLMFQVGLVGAALGVTRTVLPLLAESEFGIASKTATLSFVVAFGLAKAPLNFGSGALADRFGRKRVLIAGWLLGLPFPLLLAFAQSWTWVIAAMVLLGLQQGLCWSTTIFMKVDVAGPRRRGFAIGINEFTGYVGMAVVTHGSGAVAASLGPRVFPFLLGEALVVGGLVTALRFVDDTSHFVEAERNGVLASAVQAVRTGTFAAVCQAGLTTKIADAAAWGLLPIFLAEGGLAVETIGLLAAAYPGSWGLMQPLTGWLSDRFGRKPLIVAGMLVQALGLVVLARGTTISGWLSGITLLGSGTALVYPVLLAAAADVAAPADRASSIGHYRLWRDLGFVVGGVVAGALADAVGIAGSLQLLALFSLVSGGLVAVLYRASDQGPPETSPHP